MSERAKRLADRLKRANDDVISMVEGLSEEQWRGTTKGEGWTVAPTAHHIGATYGAVNGIIQAIANGATMPPISMDLINEGNAQHARDFKDCNRDETLTLLRDGGASAVSMVSGFSDEQLDRTAQLLEGMPEMTTEQLIEGILIVHAQTHGASIREVV